MFQQKYQTCKREVWARVTSQHRNPCPSLFHHLLVLIPCLFIAQLIVWARDSAGSCCLVRKTCSTSCFVAICRSSSPSPDGMVLTHVNLVCFVRSWCCWFGCGPCRHPPTPWHPSRSCVWVRLGNRRGGFAVPLGRTEFFPWALLQLN